MNTYSVFGSGQACAPAPDKAAILKTSIKTGKLVIIDCRKGAK